MYPEGMAGLVEGWSKNLTAGAARVPLLRSALIALWVTGAVRSSLSAASRPGTYGLYMLQMWALMRRAGRFHPAAALLYPVPVGAFLALFAPVRPEQPDGAAAAVAGQDGNGVNPLPAVLVDSGVWAVWGTTVGLAAARAKPPRFSADGPLTRPRPWENSGRTWEKVGVRHWKDSLPDLGTTFGGLSKRWALPGPEGRRLLEVETRGPRSSTGWRPSPSSPCRGGTRPGSAWSWLLTP